VRARRAPPARRALQGSAFRPRGHSRAPRISRRHRAPRARDRPLRDNGRARGGEVFARDRGAPQPIRHRPHRASHPPPLHARLRRGAALRPRPARDDRGADAALSRRIPAVAQVEPRSSRAAIRAARERAPAESHCRRYQHEFLSRRSAGAPERRVLHPPQLQRQRRLQARAAAIHRLFDREALLARVVHRGRPLTLRQAPAAEVRHAGIRRRRVSARQERGRLSDPDVDRLRSDPGRRRLRRRAARRREAARELRLVPEARPLVPAPLRRHPHPLRRAGLAARDAGPARSRRRAASIASPRSRRRRS